MKNFQIPGKTKAQKLKNLDIVLGRMARKMNKKISVMIPPVIFPQYVKEADENGVIFSAILPVLGNLTQLCLIGKHSLTDISYSIDVVFQSMSRGHTRQFTSDKAYMIEQIDIEISEVTLVEVRMFPVNVMTCVNTSLVLVPHKNQVSISSFVEQLNQYEYLLEGLEDDDV